MGKTGHYRARLLAAALSILSVLAGTNVVAQEATESQSAAEISEEQANLNEEGVRAIIRGDYEKAVALLSESLAYGEANVTYLNLGRAYQKMGNCREARRAFRNAKTAPAVDEPPPKIVDRRTEKFLAQLDESCAEEDSATQDSSPDGPVDGSDAPTDGPDAPADGPDAPPDGPDDVDVAAPPATGSNNTGAWISIGGGVAVAGAGVAMHILAQQTRNEVWNAGYVEGSNSTVYDTTQSDAADAKQRADVYNTIGISANIAGAALIGVGTYLALSGDSRETTRIRLDIGPDRAKAVLEWQF